MLQRGRSVDCPLLLIRCTNLELTEIVIAIAAFIGAVLGIYNLFRSHLNERVRLRVIPKASSFMGTDELGKDFYFSSENHYKLNGPNPADTLALEIINLSRFAVTVDDVGLVCRWGHRRMALASPILPDGGDWPRKLDARDSVIVHFDSSRLLGLEDIWAVRRAYASTRCGTTRYGTSGALKDFIRIASAR